jgi:hypothetical protein
MNLSRLRPIRDEETEDIQFNTSLNFSAMAYLPLVLRRQKIVNSIKI